MPAPAALFSIGYATKPIDEYIQQLKHYHITAVADIRSVPFSNAFFDYHQGALKQHLQKHGIRYVYLGDELGPRSKDASHYNESGQVQFGRLMHSDLFKLGVERVQSGLRKGFRIALSCAEKDPAICHRSLLVGWALKRHYHFDLKHILHTGELETQTQLEQRLMTLTNTLPDMLTPEAEATELAYQRQCECCAYRRPDTVTT